MKKNGNLFPFLSLIAGLMCLALQACLHLFFRDGRGLIPGNHALHLITIAISLGFLVFAALDISAGMGTTVIRKTFPPPPWGELPALCWQVPLP